jgi:hypothetical protein
MYDESSYVDEFSGDKDSDWPQCTIAMSLARLPTKVLKTNCFILSNFVSVQHLSIELIFKAISIQAKLVKYD